MIKVQHLNSSYKLQISNLIDKDNIWFKFDTGAINTVISLKALISTKKIQYVDKNSLKERLRVGIPTKPFKSASGDDMIGYLCKATNVEIDNVVLNQFYYYLTLNTEYPIALLGDDFISCCNFTHSTHSDIIIKSFDSANYKIKHSTDALSENEISLAFSLTDEVLEANYIKSKLGEYKNI